MWNRVGMQVLKTTAHKLAHRSCTFLNIEAVQQNHFKMHFKS